MSAPSLEELQAILTDGLAAVEAVIASRDAAPTPPASAEEAAVTEAEKAHLAARQHRDGLLAESKALDVRFEAATGAVAVDELRAVDERRGQLQYDLWESRVSVEKSNLNLLQAQRDLLGAYGRATGPGFTAVRDLADKVNRYAQRLLSWRTGRDPRFSGLGQEVGQAKLRLDSLLASPPSQASRRAVRNR